METLKEFFELFTTPEGLNRFIDWYGQLGLYATLVAIVFAETGLLIGFFLPGDSLLVTAGLLASAGKLDIFLLNVLLIPAAIIGDAVGYAIGRKSGERLLNRPDTRLFKKAHIVKTQEFYEKHGGKTIVIARFIPVIRTFAPVVAGIAGMSYKRFATYNIAGGVLWIMSTTLAGYWLGKVVPNIGRYMHFVIAGVIFLSILPPMIEFIKHVLRKRAASEEIRATEEPKNRGTDSL